MIFKNITPEVGKIKINKYLEKIINNYKTN